MAKFADEKTERDALKKCVNCGNRHTHIAAEGKLRCSRCFTDPDVKINLDGRNSYAISFHLLDKGIELYDEDPRHQNSPDRRLYFNLLTKKPTLDSCDYTLILGYETEEANYIYDISCFVLERDLLQYLKDNFTNKKYSSSESTYHVVMIFDHGCPVDFDIVIKH